MSSQVVVLPLTLFLVYRYARGLYAFVRNMAVISWTAGVIWYALQPVAPPRLLASGFTDTVSTQTFFELDSDFIRPSTTPWRRCRACTWGWRRWSPGR